jgi:hypothetical protein
MTNEAFITIQDAAHEQIVAVHCDSNSRVNGALVTKSPGARAGGRRCRRNCRESASTDDHRGLMVWEKQAGEWRLVMEQNSFSQ